MAKESAAGRSDDEAAQSRIRLAQKKKEREASRRAVLAAHKNAVDGFHLPDGDADRALWRAYLARDPDAVKDLKGETLTLETTTVIHSPFISAVKKEMHTWRNSYFRFELIFAQQTLKA